MIKIAFLVVFISISLVDCHIDCILQVPSENAPIYTQKFGSKTIVAITASELTLSEGEIITGYCSNSFLVGKFNRGRYQLQQTLSRDHNIQVFNLTCVNKKLKLESRGGYYSFDSIQFESSETFSCSKYAWSLYEVKKPFSKCQQFMSYAVGAKTFTKPFYLAGICYDLDNLSLKYINYIAKKKTLVIDHQEANFPEEVDETSLSEPVNQNFDNLLSFVNNTKFQTEYSKVAASNFWLKLFKFEYQPLVQSQEFGSEFKEFRKFLDIIWWKNLQSGNWKLFTDLLDKRISEWEYSVYMGTSGQVKIPDGHNSSEPLVVNIKCTLPFCKNSNFDRTHYNIPEYIWSYLRLRNNDSSSDDEEFVVIGYNSPYYGYFRQSEIIFCNDICHQINWLEPISRTRLMPTMGILFCCRSKDVELSLIGFTKLTAVAGRKAIDEL